MTSDFVILTDSVFYFGNDFLYVGDGKVLDIFYVGYIILYFLKCLFILINVFRVFHIIKPLLSVQKFCCDNYVYFEFYDSVFYVKDFVIKEVFFSGRSYDGFYVFSEFSVTSVFQVFWFSCISAIADLWYRRLGYLIFRILNLLVSDNKIICTSKRFFIQC